MYNDYEIANILLKKEEGKILASKEYFHSDLWILCYNDLFLNTLSKDSFTRTLLTILSTASNLSFIIISL